MIKNLMAKLGKGAARVDLVLDQEDYLPGDLVTGELVIQGGTVEQKINEILVDLTLLIRVKGKDFSHLIQQFPFYESFTIQPGEQKRFPFSCELPRDLPVSGNQVAYFFVTHLDIASGVDHSDRDYIQIHPPSSLQKVLDALNELGLREKYESRSFNGYAQEFELFPTTFLNGQVEEVEFVAGVETSGLRLLLEVDVYSWSGEREVRREIWLDHTLIQDPEALRNHLENILQEMVESPSSFRMPTSLYGGHKHSGLSKWSGAIGGFAAGALGAVVLSELMDDGEEIVSEATEALDEETGLFEDMGDFFGADD
ncbi:sporulation-control protein [Melghirimyces thermohalophilus]|uniref:Sporulation-control protein n=1 Tax=Melghirimyces thermohalophilus TaxID=1236220 RepID=A0A1G6LDS4_9BACL|nr:sporulation protein [Melghirimyces thermohalophilus]SDC41343.1 sporulation-control protein [Melghirimyces thermohalophilus]